MKSDRQAERIALVCFAVGFCGAAGAALARVASGFLAEAGCLAAGATGGASTAAGVAAAGTDCSALWQDDDRSAELAFRQSKTSGLLGAIHEQCAMKSFRVQACRTALISSSVVFAATVLGAGSDGDDAVGVSTGVAAGTAGAAAAAAGASGFGATALTAVLQDADNLPSLRSKHSSASLPPGCTLEQ